jgi:hypothetical protein
MEIRVSPFSNSSVTNRRRWHQKGKVDGRSIRARRWRDLYRAFAAELGREPSVAEDALLRSCTDLTLSHELLSADIASGQSVDVDELNRLSGGLRRTLTMLGLTGGGSADELAERKQSLAGILAEHNGR